MKRIRRVRSFLFVFVGISALISASTPSLAAWPEKPIKLVVGFPAGGSVDQVARLLGQYLSASLKQPVIIENRVGASGTIGTTAVARAPADGYTFGMVWDSHAVAPSLMKDLQYDTLRDLDYLSLIGTSPYVFVTSAKNSYSTFAEVVSLARSKNVGSYGSSGNGSLAHLAALSIFQRLNLDMLHVPYRGGAPMIQDTLGRQVDIAIGSVVLVKPLIESGSLHALAVTSQSRSPHFPNVPSSAETGVQGFNALSWWGVVAPIGVPKDIVERLVAEIQKALGDPQIAKRLQEQGLEIAGITGEAFKAFVVQEIDTWRRVVETNEVK